MDLREQVTCSRCSRSISYYSDEAADWLDIEAEDEPQAFIGTERLTLVCGDCWTEDERRDVLAIQLAIRRLRAKDRHSS